MSPSNLTAVYNNNPTLQSMYSLPDYLALFGQDSSSTPQLATAYVDPTTSTTSAPTSTGIPSIINQNLNQGGGEGDGGGNNIIGGKDYGYNSYFAKDDKVQGPQTKEEIENFLNDIGEGTIDDDDMPGFDFKGLGTFFSNLPTPFNLAKKGMKAFNDYQAEKKAKEEAAAKKAERERIAKEQIAKAEKIEAARIEAQKAQKAREAATAQRAREANASVYASADRQGFTDGRGGGFGSRSTGTNENFSNNSGRGRTGYRYGGRASYFDGGIVSLRRR